MSNPAKADPMAKEPENTGDAATDLEPPTPVNPVEALIARMEAHNTEGEAIDAELARLGLTRKKVNSILSTKPASPRSRPCLRT